MPARTRSDQPWRWTVRQAHDALTAGSISPAEYDRELRARSAEVAHLGALITDGSDRVMARTVRRAGAGPLAGIPVVLKDCIDTAGAPTTAGTRALVGRTPSRDAPAVTLLRRAGAVVAGKCALHELSFGVTSNNPITGPPRNPYDSRMICGGSSGGTAAAVAAGIAPVGIGADTGGSVRMPAALCGVVGFRPTVGRYSVKGTVPIAPTRDTLGPMARTVADVRVVDAVLAGRRPSDERVSLAGARVGVARVFLDDLDPEVDRVFHQALDLLADAGVHLVEVDLGVELEAADTAAGPISMYEFARAVTGYLREHGYGLGADELRAGIGCEGVRRAWDRSASDAMTADEYRTALEVRSRARTAFGERLRAAQVGVVLQPTAPLVARPIGQEDSVELNGRRQPTFDTYIRHTAYAGVLGLPAISLPAGVGESGLPVGVELAAAAGADETLLAYAAAVETVLPPARMPEVAGRLATGMP